MKTIFIKVPVSEHPPKWGWYDTDKGNLFWNAQHSVWSCNDREEPSEEYPKFWHQEIRLPNEKEIEQNSDLEGIFDTRFSRGYKKGFKACANYILDKITNTTK